MTFGEHLTELRSRLIKALLGTLVAVGVATAYADELVRIVAAPFQNVMRDINANPALVATGPTQSFVTYFKVSLIAGLIAGAPVWIYQVWAFIAAGLYRHERRWVFRFAPLSLLLFCGGVAFGYFVLLPVALRWLLTFASPDLIQNWISIAEYSSLFTTLTLLLGIAFQLPVVMLGLAKAGILSAAAFRGKRKITILLIFIVAGILTPPDPVTQPLVAVPLWLLYELGIVLAWAAEGARRAPVDWARWRRRGVIAAALLALVFVFRGRIARVWGGVDANQRALHATGDNLPWQAVAREVLRAEPEAGMRINDDPASPSVVVAAGTRVAVLRFSRAGGQAAILSPESRGFRVTVVPAGATVWSVDQPDGLRAGSVLDPVVRALRAGSQETRRTARVIAAAAAGIPLPEGDDEAASALEDWLASRRDAPFAQHR
jgi:sec-independent protein translocase protein TatC